MTTHDLVNVLHLGFEPEPYAVRRAHHRPLYCRARPSGHWLADWKRTNLHNHRIFPIEIQRFATKQSGDKCKATSRLFVLGALMLFARAASAQTYVGSFQVNDGPYWGTNPSAYSGQEAVALLFGGQPADYAISTNPSTTDPATITHTAHYSTWGLGCGVFPETHRVDDAPPGYGDPGGPGTASSAYVQDWCTDGETNYVWVTAAPVAVPTLGQWGLLILSLAAAGLGMGRLRRS